MRDQSEKFWSYSFFTQSFTEKTQRGYNVFASTWIWHHLLSGGDSGYTVKVSFHGSGGNMF